MRVYAQNIPKLFHLTASKIKLTKLSFLLMMNTDTIIIYDNHRMAGSALKRLMAEHRQLMKNPPEGIVAGPKSDDNYFEWEANILGPPDTCFEFGVFKASLTFPKDYPMSPPKMKFLSDICHPNVYADGELVLVSHF